MRTNAEHVRCQMLVENYWVSNTFTVATAIVHENDIRFCCHS